MFLFVFLFVFVFVLEVEAGEKRIVLMESFPRVTVGGSSEG